MKKRLLYLIVLIQIGAAGSVSVYGQSMLDKLTGKTWEFEHPAGKQEYEIKDRYSNSNRTSAIYARGKELSEYQPFYLSDTVDARFDDSKVGKNRNGKYLIIKGEPGNEVGSFAVFEILKLNSTEFVIKSLRSNSVFRHRAV